MKKRRFLLVLNENSSSSVKKTEKLFNTKIISTSELSSQVRAQNVYDTGDALFMKNLGIVVLEEDDLERVQSISEKSDTIIHLEESRMIFRPVNELSKLDELKQTIKVANDQIQELEALLLAKIEKPNDSPLTWGLRAIGMDNAKFDGKGVNVCILDTGFYKLHPDFKNREIEGKSFVPGEIWEDDSNGHGTHCTGTAAGSISSENGLRYGVASACKIAIGKVLDNEGSGATDWIVDAIDNCIEKKYKIISMSLGAPVSIGQRPSAIFEHIGQEALRNNCLLIAAAGNDSNRPATPRPVSSPANCESFMAVAAIDRNLKVASFSNAGINVSNGGKVDIAAPGVEIYSSFSPNTLGGKFYKSLNGTSMATPHVAGVAALLCQAFPNDSASELWRKLEKKTQILHQQLTRDVGSGLTQAI